MLCIGFDVGGTFIDLVAYDTETGNLRALKQRSSRRNAAQAVKSALQVLLTEQRAFGGEVLRLAHGTTLVTNILVERTGARVGVLTTAGFRDVMNIGRMRRPHLYDLTVQKPAPLCERGDIHECEERIAANGAVISPINVDHLKSEIEAMRKDGIEAVAVCFLNSYANPTHEKIAAQYVMDAGMAVSCSANVSAEYGEYERFTTCVMNSYVAPVLDAYLTEVASGIQSLEIKAPLEVMQSNGGVIPVPTAQRFPVRLASSGPAAGVSGAALLARQVGRSNLITLDMGGTSTDVSLVVNGEPASVSEHDLDGLPVRTVSIDIRSIGAGGGSLARLDRTGALRVGPESAGAEPGPACYGWGGVRPTMADADVVLGYLSPERFCSGRVPLYPEKARAAITETVAGPKGVSVEEAALGILNVCVTNMVGAVRNITMERGYDPRDFTLVAFGGAGPMHATFVAEELGIPEVLILREPGLLSAKGLLLTDYRSDVFQTVAQRLDDLDCDVINAQFDAMKCEATSQLPVGDGDARTRRIVELCYESQQNPIPVEVTEYPICPEHLPGFAARLAEKFHAVFGFAPQNRKPQLLHLRVLVERGTSSATITERVAFGKATTPPQPRETRTSYFPTTGTMPIEAPVYDRDSLSFGVELQGPLIVEEEYSNTIVAPGQTVRVDDVGNLVVRISQ